MKTLLTSVASVADKFFDKIWEAFPNGMLLIVGIGFTVWLSYKVITFFTGIQQSIVDIHKRIDGIHKRIDDVHERIDKRIDDVYKTIVDFKKDVAMAFLFQQKIFENAFNKAEERASSFEKEVNLRFERVDEKFISFEREMNLRFERVDEKFDDMNRRFDSLETKMDKVIDILLLSNQEQKSHQPLRKS